MLGELIGLLSAYARWYLLNVFTTYLKLGQPHHPYLNGVNMHKSLDSTLRNEYKLHIKKYFKTLIYHEKVSHSGLEITKLYLEISI